MNRDAKGALIPKVLPAEERARLESYLLSLSNAKAMLEEGIIDLGDFDKAEAFLARKYCIKKLSIYRPNDLINTPFRAIYIHEEKEVR